MNTEPKNTETLLDTKQSENTYQNAQIIINTNETSCEYDNWFSDFPIL